METESLPIKHPRLRTKFEVVTPELAAKWLELVPEFQRNVSERRVSRYARDMRNDKWTTSTDHIGFDIHGRLVNGQHRLRGLIEAGVTLTLGVDYGLETDAFGNTDTGYGRTFAQQLGGVKYGNNMGAAARLIMTFGADGDPRMKNHRSLWTNAEVREFVLEDKDNMELTAAAAFRIGKAVGGLVSAWHAFIYLTEQVSEKNSWEFYNSVLEGAELTSGDARLALRNLLAKRVRTEAMTNPGLQLGIMIKAWNDWMTLTPRQVLTFKDVEDFPVLVKRRKRLPESDAIGDGD